MLSIILGKLPASVIAITEGFDPKTRKLPEKSTAFILKSSGNELATINVFQHLIEHPVEIKITELVEKPYREHILLLFPNNEPEKQKKQTSELLSISLLGVFKNPDRFDELLSKKDPAAYIGGYLLFPLNNERTNVHFVRQDNGKIPIFCLDPA